MKASFLLLALLSASTTLSAAVPSLLSYQGYVTDASGQPIGNAAPVNRTTTFRFYTDASGGEPIYAETQTVTISAGQFSVLIGNGTGVSGQPGPSAPAAQPYMTVGDIVNGTSGTALYLGITVDDGNPSTNDAEISPRQQLVSGVYAIRAKVAEGVAPRSVTTAMIADNAITTGQIAAGSINASKIAPNAITTALIADASINPTKLDEHLIGVWKPSGSNVWRPGNVGIGANNPGVPLTFDNVLGDKISFWGNAGTGHYGIGIQGSTFQYYTSNAGAHHSWGYGSSESFTEWMRLSNGNLGIGTKNPTARLHVVGDILATPANWGTNGASSYVYLGDTSNWLRSVFNGATELYGANAIALKTGTGAPERLRILANGNIGVNTANPSNTFEVAGSTAIHDANVAPDDAYNGILRLTRPAGAAQYINLVRAGRYPWSIGFEPNTNNFAIGPGVGNDSSFGGFLTIDTSGHASVHTGDRSQGFFSVGGSLVSVGTRAGTTGYAKIYFDQGIMYFEAWNTNHNPTSWRGFSYDGDSNLDFLSDRRLKKDIVDAEPMLDRLLKVRFRRFRWIDSTDPNQKREFGVIAQEVQPLFPDIVGQRADGHFTVGYTTFGTIAAHAVQELAQRTDDNVTALQQQLDAVHAELSEKEARIADLEARLQALENAVLNKR